MARDNDNLQQKKIAGLINEIDLLKAEITELKGIELPELKMTVEEAQAILKNQTAKITFLVSEIESCKQNKAKRLASIEEYKVKIFNAKKLKSEKEAEAQKTLNQIALRDANIDELFSWYKNAISFISSLSSCIIISATDQEIIFDFQAQRQYRISLEFGKNNSLLQIYCSEGNVYIQDLLDYCKAKGNISLLVREACARIEAWENRMTELESLKQLYIHFNL